MSGKGILPIFGMPKNSEMPILPEVCCCLFVNKKQSIKTSVSVSWCKNAQSSGPQCPHPPIRRQQGAGVQRQAEKPDRGACQERAHATV